MGRLREITGMKFKVQYEVTINDGAIETCSTIVDATDENYAGAIIKERHKAASIRKIIALT